MSGYFTPDQMNKTRTSMFDQNFIDSVQKLRKKLQDGGSNTGEYGGYGNTAAKQMFEGQESSSSSPIAGVLSGIMGLPGQISSGLQFPSVKPFSGNGNTGTPASKQTEEDPESDPLANSEAVEELSPIQKGAKAGLAIMQGQVMPQVKVPGHAADQPPAQVPTNTDKIFQDHPNKSAQASSQTATPASSYQTPNPATPQPSAPATGYGYNGPHEAMMQAIRDEYEKHAPPINLGVMDTIGNIGAMLRNGYDTYNSWQNGIENPTPQEQATAAEMLRSGAEPAQVNQYMRAMRMKSQQAGKISPLVQIRPRR